MSDVIQQLRDRRKELQEEVSRLDTAIDALTGKKKGSYRHTAAARKKIGLAVKARFEAQRKSAQKKGK